MSKLKTIIFFTASSAFFGISCATDSVSFSHPNPANKISLDYAANCGEFTWEISFTQTIEGVRGSLEVRHAENSLKILKLNNDILEKFSRLELPAVTCTSREGNDGLFSTTDLLLLGVNSSGEDTDYMIQISVDEALQYDLLVN